MGPVCFDHPPFFLSSLFFSRLPLSTLFSLSSRLFCRALSEHVLLLGAREPCTAPVSDQLLLRLSPLFGPMRHRSV